MENNPISTSAYQILKIALKANQTIAAAESCTAGFLSVHLSEPPGATDTFLGAVTAYSEQAKIRLLHVDAEAIKRFGVVSEEVASLMADGARKIFASDWAISTTGYSGPTGGTAKAPLGTLCVAISGPGDTKTRRYLLENLSRTQHQQKSCELILELFLEILKREIHK